MNRCGVFKASICLVLAVVALFSLTLLTGCSEKTAQTFNIKIAHTGDIGACVESGDKTLGVERLKTVMDGFGDGDLKLALDSGNLFAGMPIADLQKGESIAKLVKECGFDAMAPGNNDWNYTKERLPELENIAGLEILAGNVIKTDGSKFFDKEFLIKEVKKGDITLKIGVMGMIDSTLYSSVSPTNADGISFTDAEQYAVSASQYLREQEGCGIVIAIAHVTAPVALAKKIDGVDLWLCGHDRLRIGETVTTPDGTLSYIAEEGANMEQVGLIDLTVGVNKKGKVTEMKFNKTDVTYESADSYAKDPAVTAVLNEILSETQTTLENVIGANPVHLNGDSKDVRTTQTNLGTAVATAYMNATGAEIGIENAGGIRASIEKGIVTYDDIMGVNSFGNRLVTKRVSGKAIKEAMEFSLDCRAQTLEAYQNTDPFIEPECSGSSLHIAGMALQCDMTAEWGSRVLSITVGGDPLDENRLYTVAMSDFVATSIDFPMFSDVPADGEFGSCQDALINFFKQDEKAILKAVNAVVLIEK